ncbi:hypothetical protein E6W39_26685 [Kitasatospora acidiphila]|uniref:Uncharacterized protein n=1 Tax=Kitasatospora acidiphila TaxID=2567942 RepID=A0A540WEY3_9ACTN|nr:hypothetical protein E6W39_26685 [Kitasatospora acidiphila]
MAQPDDTTEITCASLWLSQAELWYWVANSLPGTKPLQIVYISGQNGLSAARSRCDGYDP